MTNRKFFSDYFWLIIRVLLIFICFIFYFISWLFTNSIFDGTLLVNIFLIVFELIYFFKVTGKYKKPIPWMIFIYAFLAVDAYDKENLLEILPCMVTYITLFIIHTWRYIFDLFIRERKIKNRKVNILRIKALFSILGDRIKGSYGLILQDDLKVLHGTFAKRYKAVGSVIILDWEKDLKRLWNKLEGDIHCEPSKKYKRGKILKKYKKDAAFYIALLECEKYSQEEFGQKIYELALMNHHMVSRPVYIFLVRLNDIQAEYIKRVSWMKEVNFIEVNDGSEIDLEQVVQKYKVSNSEKIKSVNSIYEQLLIEQNINTNLEDYKNSKDLSMALFDDKIPKNMFISGFMQNYFDADRKNIAILAAFDYVDMVLRFFTVYVTQKYCLNYSQGLDDIVDMSEFVRNNIDSEEKIYDKICSKVKVTFTVREALDEIEKLYPIKFDGNEMGFTALVRLLNYIRNRSRGHGSITYGIANKLWKPLYVLLVLLDKFLCIEDLCIEVRNDLVSVGYDLKTQIFFDKFDNVFGWYFDLQR